eukprot:1380991-Amorphochlora_amoeboformis.AAC.3
MNSVAGRVFSFLLDLSLSSSALSTSFPSSLSLHLETSSSRLKSSFYDLFYDVHQLHPNLSDLMASLNKVKKLPEDHISRVKVGSYVLSQVDLDRYDYLSGYL